MRPLDHVAGRDRRGRLRGPDQEADGIPEFKNQEELDIYIGKLESDMREAAKRFEFEKAAKLEGYDQGAADEGVFEERCGSATCQDSVPCDSIFPNDFLCATFLMGFSGGIPVISDRRFSRS